MQLGFVGTGTMGNATDNTLQCAQAQGWGQQGYPVVARVLEAMAGIELHAPAASDEAGYQADDPRRGEEVHNTNAGDRYEYAQS